ncbi:MAG: NAD(+) synthase [Flavobacteriaceae bacterium]|nr:NAD(+) synthase [Flavobacteriaceae bacterium]
MKTKDVVDHIINWLNAYVEESKLDGFVVGVSGGVDSALTSALCANTGKPTLCLEMPIHQESNQVSRANRHTSWLAKNFSNVRAKVVPLNDLYDSFCKLDAAGNDNTNTLLSLANTRSRLRMATLYYFASQERFLVAGTGNKVEDFGVGFYTKYGDGGVDVSPIADLMKSEVRELAAHLGVHESIVNAAPTDGLLDDNRTDEDQLGATYDELEWAMQQQENGKITADFTGRDKTVFSTYEKHHTMNKHKMIPIPICVIPQQLK